MTNPDHEIKNLINEIKEDVRKDEALHFLKKYSVHIFATVTLLITGSLGYAAWSWHKAKKQEEATLYLLEAINSQQKNASEKAVRYLNSLENSYGYSFVEIGTLLQANTLVQQEKEEDALALYEQLAQKPNTPKMIVYYARTRALYIKVNKKIDAALLAEVEPLIESRNPWHYSAAELKGVVQMTLAEKDKTYLKPAQTTFQGLLSDPSTPSSIKSRVRLHLNRLDLTS